MLIMQLVVKLYASSSEGQQLSKKAATVRKDGEWIGEDVIVETCDYL